MDLLQHRSAMMATTTLTLTFLASSLIPLVLRILVQGLSLQYVLGTGWMWLQQLLVSFLCSAPLLSPPWKLFQLPDLDFSTPNAPDSTTTMNSLDESSAFITSVFLSSLCHLS
jgi:hypothetical protein